ncbi:hypothetical protein GLOIN_2v1788498 [Rhizophagus clarus]|uniref:RNase H type-1 domain-containing protein n=2 Tax=Rhizophagus clarus TaxID=94130 RepID=A0A8H3LWC2_9GLOM|nr:hypothetical protein GLOIN_2v1788498 [Rhizophagus clarus]
MDLKLVKVKRHSGDKMNEIADKLTKSASSSSNYFNNRFNYSNRTVRFFPVYKNIPIEYNLRKFIKTLMNTKVAAEWSQLKTNEKKLPKLIVWNITWNLIHKYKGFNCISVKKHWYLIFIIKLFAKILPIGFILIQRKSDIYKDFVCRRCNDNKKEDLYHFIICKANKEIWSKIRKKIQDDLIHTILKLNNQQKSTDIDIYKKLNKILGIHHNSREFTDFCILALKAKINNNLFNLAKQLFEFTETKNTIFMVTLLDSFIIHFKELIWLPRCTATIVWEKANNIERKDKLSKSENMEHYFKSSHQQTILKARKTTIGK